MRILDGQVEAFEKLTAFQYTDQDANTCNMHSLWEVCNGKMKDSFTDASDPKLSVVSHRAFVPECTIKQEEGYKMLKALNKGRCRL